MAATFAFDEDYGAQTGSPTRGTSQTTGITNVNWSNNSDPTTVYSSNPITAGNNSYDRWQFGHFSGTFNQILGGLFAHTAVALTDFLGAANLTLKGTPACTGDGDRLLYTTPVTTDNATLTTDMTAVTAIGSGVAVFFGATGPYATGKAASMTTNPCYTNYLTTQLQSAAGCAANDTSTITLTLRYQEN